MTVLDSRPVATRPAHVAGVAVLATDPLVRAGLVGELRDKPGIELLDDPAEADVVVAVAESTLRELLPVSARRLVLITDSSRQAELWSAVEHGLAVLVPRGEVTTPRLLRAPSPTPTAAGATSRPSNWAACCAPFPSYTETS